MYSFAAVFGAPTLEAAQRCVRRAGYVLNDVMPKQGVTLRAHSASFEKPKGGWVTIEPDGSRTRALVQIADAGALSVLVHGRVSGAADSAKTVAEVFGRAGVQGVRSLDGAFSAIILNRESGRLILCSDLIGQMTSRWLVQDGMLFLASHDVGLVAASNCPVEPDPASALSIALFDWSVGGRPLLSGASVASPLYWYEWEHGRFEAHFEPPFAERKSFIDGSEGRTSVDILDQTLDTLVSETSRVCENTDNIVLSLTGGLDSRLLLALLLGAKTRTPIRAVTSGSPWSVDVVSASALAHLTGIAHQRTTQDIPDATRFVEHAERYAFHCNGDTSSKRALSNSRIDPGETRLTGGAGELYRGYYYGLIGSENALSAEAITARLWGKARGRRRAIEAAADVSLLSQVNERLSEILIRYQSFSSSAYDLLDYFYLFERYGRWGSLVSRRVWWDVRSPLACPSAVRTAFTLPSPIGEHCAIHERGARRYLPKLGYWLPVNGTSVLPLTSTNLGRRLAGAGSLLDKGLRRIDSIVVPTESIDAVFAGALHPVVNELLSRSGSVSERVFGERGVAELLSAHHQKKTLTEPISCLVSVELWLAQVNRAKELVRRVE